MNPDVAKQVGASAPARDVAWTVRASDGNGAQLGSLSHRADAVRVEITAAATTALWDIQANLRNLRARRGHPYILSLEARADTQRTVGVGFSRAEPPWDGLGLYRRIELTSEWQRQTFEFVSTADAEKARIHIDVGGTTGTVDLASVRLNGRLFRVFDDVLRHVAQPSKAPLERSYIVCATPRSGSTLLCELLARSGLAGVPDEWMLRSNESLASTAFALPVGYADAAYLAEIIARSRTPNGVFGLKVMWPEMEQLRFGTAWKFGPHHSSLGLNEFPNLSYVRMVRRDRVRQAVSLYLAARTTRWHRMRKDEHLAAPWPLEELEAELSTQAKRREVATEIAAHRTLIDQQESSWNRFFRGSVKPFEVTYEDLVATPELVTHDALTFLGVDAEFPVEIPRTWHVQMSDARNERLLAAYHEFFDAGGEFNGQPSH